MKNDETDERSEIAESLGKLVEGGETTDVVPEDFKLLLQQIIASQDAKDPPKPLVEQVKNEIGRRYDLARRKQEKETLEKLFQILKNNGYTIF